MTSFKDHLRESALKSTDLKNGDFITLKDGREARIDDNQRGKTRKVIIWDTRETIFIDISDILELSTKQEGEGM